MRAREGFLLFLLLAGLGGVAEVRGWLEPVHVALYDARPPQETVLFVVIDTVRADHLSLCGYDRPNTPFLEELAERGATWTCTAYAPGSWTFPSHASFFTGLPVTEHGSHFVGEGTEIRKLTIRPLPDDLPTLAEQFSERGYQALGVSGNPVLAPASGLGRGFDRWLVAPAFGTWYGERLTEQLGPALRELDKDRPLFLFVNIADAHDPWPGVPEGVGWVPPYEDRLLYFTTDPESGAIEPGEWGAYVTGTMAEPEAFQQRVTDLYDYAVFKADRTLRSVVGSVEAHGWSSAGLRLVVVADHGEFLGEHRLLRHGRYLWEGNQRVPLLAMGVEGEVPALASAQDVHSLVLDGRIAEPAPVEAVAFPDRTWFEVSGGVVGGSTSAAIWSGDEKLLWVDGEAVVYSLSDDPGEERPRPLGDHPLRGELEALVERVTASAAREMETDPELVEALRAAGYVE